MSQITKLHHSLFAAPPTIPGELNQVTRLFDLRNGECLSLRGVDGDDYLFVLRGYITVTAPDGIKRQLVAGDSQRNLYLLPEINEGILLNARGNSLLYHVNAGRLEQLMLWDELIRGLDPEAKEHQERMQLVAGSRVFRKFPVEHIEEAVACMVPVSVKKGDCITKQGEPGDSFYVIVSGEASVEQYDEIDEELDLLDLLKTRDSFGEDALVTGENRRATIVMKTDGSLLKLHREDFDRLLSRPLVNRVQPEQAQALIENEGYIFLDVRIADEIELYGQIPNSILSPVDELHNNMSELQSIGKPFVVYCRSGKRSALAVMRLAQYDIKAVSLEGGIKEWPYQKDGGFL